MVLQSVTAAIKTSDGPPHNSAPAHAGQTAPADTSIYGLYSGSIEQIPLVAFGTNVVMSYVNRLGGSSLLTCMWSEKLRHTVSHHLTSLSRLERSSSSHIGAVRYGIVSLYGVTPELMNCIDPYQGCYQRCYIKAFCGRFPVPRHSFVGPFPGEVYFWCVIKGYMKLLMQ